MTKREKKLQNSRSKITTNGALVKWVEAQGWVKSRQGATSHIIFASPDGSRKVTVPCGNHNLNAAPSLVKSVQNTVRGINTADVR